MAAAPLSGTPRVRPPVDLFSVETRMYPSLRLDDPTPGTFEENARVTPRPVRLQVALPWRVRTERSMFSVSFGYERLGLELEGWPRAEAFPRGPFHSVQLPMSFSRTLRDERWGTRFFLTPGLSSDFHDTGSRGFRVQGGALLERKNAGGAFSFGLVLINDYGSPRVFPAVAWMGRVAEKQVVAIRLPVVLSWTYQASEEWDAGFAARVSGGNYAIGRPDIFRNRQLKYSAGTLGPFVKRSFGKWSVNVESGWVFLHSLEVVDQRHQIRDYDLDRSAFLTVGLRRSL